VVLVAHRRATTSVVWTRLVIVNSVVQQHVDDAGALAGARQSLTRAAHLRLTGLLRADRRLAAHLDGLRVAGEHGRPMMQAALEMPSPGVVFTAATDALERNDSERLDQLIALAEAVPQARDGLLYALGWTGRSRLKGIVPRLLGNGDGFKPMVGLAVCAMHRVDPGPALHRLAEADVPTTRARALRTFGELGMTDWLPTCVDVARRDADPEVRFWSAWSAALLGDRSSALDLLIDRGSTGGEHRMRALRLALQAMTRSAAHSALQSLASNSGHLRWLIAGSGLGGDPEYVAWLIRHMSDLKNARVAGEAFALLTGADFPEESLDRPAPENFESGPNDDPDDPNVDTDPDDGLPWPDVAKIEAWWAASSDRFQKGVRYFMGAPVSREHCIEILKNGYQRQRILAAHYLCLLDPGTPLFNTSAPAWRQQKLLATMT
jgi:uncharacterized protein (TIGR02270 family)